MPASSGRRLPGLGQRRRERDSNPRFAPCDKLTRRVKFRFFRNPNHRYKSRHPVPKEGALAIVTERWGRSCGGRGGIVRGKGPQGGITRERSSDRVDERCRSVRQNRVDPMPQWSASSLWKAHRPDRARMSRFSAGDGGEKSPILRGERDISRKAIAQEVGCLKKVR